MANARAVLEEAINEANLLAGSGGTLEELQALAPSRSPPTTRATARFWTMKFARAVSTPPD
jgi:hypothetical protein